MVPWQDEQVADIERTPAGVKFAGAKAGAGGGVGAAGVAGAAAGAGVTGLTGAGADAADVAGACANAWLANRSVADRAVMIFMILLVIKVFLCRSMLDDKPIFSLWTFLLQLVFCRYSTSQPFEAQNNQMTSCMSARNFLALAEKLKK